MTMLHAWIALLCLPHLAGAAWPCQLAAHLATAGTSRVCRRPAPYHFTLDVIKPPRHNT